MWVTGKMMKQTVTGCKFGLMAQNMRATGKTTKEMVTESTYTEKDHRRVKSTMDNSKTANVTGMESTFVLMAPNTRANSKTTKEMVTESTYSEKDLSRVTSTMDNSKTANYNGHGVYIYASGAIYVGDFKDG